MQGPAFDSEWNRDILALRQNFLSVLSRNVKNVKRGNFVLPSAPSKPQFLLTRSATFLTIISTLPSCAWYSASRGRILYFAAAGTDVSYTPMWVCLRRALLLASRKYGVTRILFTNIHWMCVWTRISSIQEEIKSRLKSGNSCYHSVQNLLSSSLLTKHLKTEI
jgi:hypothetical protein